MLRNLQKKEFIDVIPKLVNIAYNCNEYGFTENTVAGAILDFYLVNENASYDSYWRIILDYFYIKIIQINI